MKIVCFNVNGIRARLHQLQAVIDSHQPDIIGLQETKVHNEEFPLADIKAMGYHVEIHGQKGHYGVCLMSRQAPLRVQKGFTHDDDDAQKRLIIADYPCANGSEIRVINGYFPQGESIHHDTKFPAKRRFYSDLQAYLQQECDPEQPLVVMGDFNISPLDLDIGIGEANRKRWLQTGKSSFQPEEREWYQRLTGWGLTDSFRYLHPENDQVFSWFDYRSRGFEAEPKRGLRIDGILLSKPLLGLCQASNVDYTIRGMEKPSDHAPIWAELNIS
ncbi:exodeoxyribonuclease III [Neptuniibacter sp. CAU 1671]|uniref:exodeoxyribonuclease III n=1 Tax=Neptuniibacter sp. CAU 1671 TaxID=3032593 RepID=UPI0023D9B792|nr:exodeoxyribonuclease III [Neptuniibacter sp. CAU 1671]MDF2182873.1 exodeoxyribonuclease III [Neptuniibacter sp. CAU 1671]